MSDVSKTSSTMKNQIKSQETEISKLRGRLNQLVDNIAVLENDLGMFKKNVSKDLLDVIDSLKEKQDRSQLLIDGNILAVLKDQNDDVWRLYDLEGDIVLLDFSAMWCGPCQSAASTVQEIQDFYNTEDFQYITILIDDTTGDTVELDEVQFWADTFGIETQPVLQGNRDLVDGDPSLGYPISSWPTFIFVDRDLSIFWGIYGYSEEYLRMVIEDML